MRLADLEVRDILRVGLLSLIVIVFLSLLGRVLAPFWVPLSWAAIIVQVTWPWRQRLCRHMTPWLAALLMTCSLTALAIVPFLFLSLTLVHEMQGIFQHLAASDQHWDWPTWLSQHPTWQQGWQRLPSSWRALAQPQTLTPDLQAWALRLGAVLGGVGRLIGLLGLIWITSLIFYRHGDVIGRALRDTARDLMGAAADRYLQILVDTLRAVAYGIFATALAQGSLAGLGYWVAGVPAPVLLAALTMFFSLIPFGTPIVWGAASLWLLWQGQIGAGIGLFLWGALVVSWVDNLIRPWVISSAVHLPFLLILFGILGGLLAFGFLGLFVGPMVLSVALAWWRAWRLERGLTPIF